MSSDNKSPIQPVAEPLSIHELGAVLVRHYGIHEGLYNVLVEFQIGVGPVGPKESLTPGAMIGVSKIGLMASTEAGPATVDASEVNPKKRSRKKSDK